MPESTDKIIICGDTKLPLNILNQLFGGESEPTLFTLHQNIIPKQNNFTLISSDKTLLDTCHDKYPKIIVDDKDASDDEVLIKHNIRSAKAIVISYEDDRENLLITLSTRQLNPKIRIVVTCSMVETMKPKLIRAGASSVISPSSINGLKMSSQLVRPNATEFLDTFLHNNMTEFSVAEVIITDSDPNIGRSLFESEYASSNLIVIAISRDDSSDITYNPASNYKLRSCDILLVLGTRENFQKLSSFTHYHLHMLGIDE